MGLYGCSEGLLFPTLLVNNLQCSRYYELNSSLFSFEAPRRGFYNFLELGYFSTNVIMLEMVMEDVSEILRIYS